MGTLLLLVPRIEALALPNQSRTSNVRNPRRICIMIFLFASNKYWRYGKEINDNHILMGIYRCFALTDFEICEISMRQRTKRLANAYILIFYICHNLYLSILNANSIEICLQINKKYLEYQKNKSLISSYDTALSFKK